MIVTTDSVKAIGGALLKFHAEADKIYKDATNPFFKSSYAPLPTILEGIKKPLQAAGLVFSQFPVDTNGLTTLLIHPESGEWIRGTFFMTPSKNDPQGQGSVITYQRRYALGAILGLNIDQDDDGNAASGKRGGSSEQQVNAALADIKAADNITALQNVFMKYGTLSKNAKFLEAIKSKKKEL